MAVKKEPKFILFQDLSNQRFIISRIIAYSELVETDRYWDGEYGTRYSILLNDKKKLLYKDEGLYLSDLKRLDLLFSTLKPSARKKKPLAFTKATVFTN